MPCALHTLPPTGAPWALREPVDQGGNTVTHVVSEATREVFTELRESGWGQNKTPRPGPPQSRTGSPHSLRPWEWTFSRTPGLQASSSGWPEVLIHKGPGLPWLVFDFPQASFPRPCPHRGHRSHQHTGRCVPECRKNSSAPCALTPDVCWFV